MLVVERMLPLEALKAAFGERLQYDVPLARYTTARVGGPAEALLVANTANDLAEICYRLEEIGVPFLVLGGGSNVLVSDAGIHGAVVLLNRSRQYRFRDGDTPPTVWAESGVNFGALARQAGARGLSGLEWAAGIPGTIGGAVVGNAGAHGGDMSANLVVAEILHQGRREQWPVERMEYAYRTSILKRRPHSAVVLSATLRLNRSTPEAVQSKIEEFTARRQRTQPPGASMGSMFKNPPANVTSLSAGRLIDEAGLKGVCVGDAEISKLHGNFFINRGRATAMDIYRLIELARNTVRHKFGVDLELEVELLGDWSLE